MAAGVLVKNASPSRPTDSGRFSPAGRAAGRKKKGVMLFSAVLRRY